MSIIHARNAIWRWIVQVEICKERGVTFVYDACSSWFAKPILKCLERAGMSVEFPLNSLHHSTLTDIFTMKSLSLPLRFCRKRYLTKKNTTVCETQLHRISPCPRTFPTVPCSCLWKHENLEECWVCKNSFKMSLDKSQQEIGYSNSR